MALSRRASGVIWLSGYLVLMAGIATGMFVARNRLIRDLSSPEQLESWDAWRETAARQDGTHGPVQRIVPPSAEPPLLLMLRDHFPVIFAASVIFPGLILGFLMFVLHGVLRQAGEMRPS